MIILKSIKIVTSLVLGLLLFWALIPYIGFNYLYGTTSTVSGLSLFLSIFLMLNIFIAAVMQKENFSFISAFLIILLVFLIASATGAYNNLMFSLRYGNKIQGEVNVTAVHACNNKTQRSVPYAIDEGKMIVLCPQSNDSISGVLYKTDIIAIPDFLKS